MNPWMTIEMSNGRVDMLHVRFYSTNPNDTQTHKQNLAHFGCNNATVVVNPTKGSDDDKECALRTNKKKWNMRKTFILSNISIKSRRKLELLTVAHTERDSHEERHAHRIGEASQERTKGNKSCAQTLDDRVTTWRIFWTESSKKNVTHFLRVVTTVIFLMLLMHRVCRYFSVTISIFLFTFSICVQCKPPAPNQTSEEKKLFSTQTRTGSA